MKNKVSKEFFAFITTVKADDSKNWRSILFAVFLLIWDGANIYFYVTKHIYLFFFILFHLLAILLSVLYIYYSNKRDEDLRYPLLILMAVFTAGPFGLLGFIILTIFYPICRYFSTPFVRWLKDLFPEGASIFGDIFERIKAGWDDYSQPVEVTPFMDIFNYGTLLQKQAVLDTIIKDFTPEYAPVLKCALDDSSNIIRIQAAAIVAKIDDDFEKELHDLTQEGSLNNPATLLKLARHFDAHAFTGVLDPVREKENQEKALHYYQEYLKKKPEDRNAWFAVGRLFFRLEDFSNVIKWFEEYREKFQDLSGNAKTWYLEALYMLQQYAELSHWAKQVYEEVRREPLPKEVLGAVETWSK